MSDNPEWLQKNEDQRRALFAEAQSLLEEYSRATVPFLKGWFERFAKITVTSQPEITNGLKPDDLQELRREVDALVQRVPGIVATTVSVCKDWTDFRTDVQGVPFQPGSLNVAIRSAAAEIVPVLWKHGFKVEARHEHGYLVYSGILGEAVEMKNIRTRYLAVQAQIAANLWDSARPPTINYQPPGAAQRSEDGSTPCPP